MLHGSNFLFLYFIPNMIVTFELNVFWRVVKFICFLPDLSRITSYITPAAFRQSYGPSVYSRKVDFPEDYYNYVHNVKLLIIISAFNKMRSPSVIFIYLPLVFCNWSILSFISSIKLQKSYIIILLYLKCFPNLKTLCNA